MNCTWLFDFFFFVRIKKEKNADCDVFMYPRLISNFPKEIKHETNPGVHLILCFTSVFPSVYCRMIPHA